jgi:hypothetical protein
MMYIRFIGTHREDATDDNALLAPFELNASPKANCSGTKAWAIPLPVRLPPSRMKSVTRVEPPS